MKALFIAVFVTFIFALIIIHHDAQRTKAGLNKDIKIIICSGTIVKMTK